MAYYKDVREYLDTLEANGKLVRVTRPINKDTEMHPASALAIPRVDGGGAARVSVREGRRRQRTKLRYAGRDSCYAGSLDIYALGMQCEKDEIFGKWTHAQAHPVKPVTVTSAPCQERIIPGSS